MTAAIACLALALVSCEQPTGPVAPVIEQPEPTPEPQAPPVEDEPETTAPTPEPEPPAFVPAAGCVYVLDADDAIIYEAGPYDSTKSYDLRHRVYSTYVVPELDATGGNPPYRVVGSRP